MSGKIEWIGVRPERRGDVISVSSVTIDEANGLSGDHPTKPHRQVTIISKEQLDEVARRLGKEHVETSATRRNILISGLDFDTVDKQRIQLGSAIIEVTGYCHPCSRMDENLGEGGRLAMARLAGYLAKVIRSGEVAVGDPVSVLKQSEVLTD